jgi:hypothetical protein
VDQPVATALQFVGCSGNVGNLELDAGLRDLDV